jgi:hypothetical protein
VEFYLTRLVPWGINEFSFHNCFGGAMKRMITIIIQVSIFFFITGTLVFALKLLYHTLNPDPWGWPFYYRWISVMELLACLLPVLYLIFLKNMQPYMDDTRITMHLVLIIIFWAGCLYLIQESRWNKIISNEKMPYSVVTEEEFSRFEPCQMVRVFAESGAFRLIAGLSSVGNPPWMHKHLDILPKEVVAECMGVVSKELQERIVGDSFERMKATMAIHALAYEAQRLKLEGYPQINEMLHVMVCNKRVDPTGKLTYFYYQSKIGGLIDFSLPYAETRKKIAEKLCE